MQLSTIQIESKQLYFLIFLIECPFDLNQLTFELLILSNKFSLLSLFLFQFNLELVKSIIQLIIVLVICKLHSQLIVLFRQIRELAEDRMPLIIFFVDDLFVFFDGLLQIEDILFFLAVVVNGLSAFELRLLIFCYLFLKINNNWSHLGTASQTIFSLDIDLLD